MQKRKKKLAVYLTCILLLSLFNFATCKYSFKDTSPIPQEVKTFRVNYLENKAQYVNTQLSPQLTEKLKQKIINTTRLRQTNDDDAHYDISGFVSQYYTSTVAISGNNASGNRLTVSFHLVFRNTLDEKTEDGPAQNMMKKDHAALQSVNFLGFLVPSCARACNDTCDVIKHLQRSFQRKCGKRFGAAMENGGKAMACLVIESILEIPMQTIGGNQYVVVHRLHAV